VAGAGADLDCPWSVPDEQRLVLAPGESLPLQISRAEMPLPAHGNGPVLADWAGASFLASFDEALPTGRVWRCHLLRSRDAASALYGGDAFVRLAQAAGLQSSRVAARCQAYLWQRALPGAAS
jgi:hypothetical protein